MANLTLEYREIPTNTRIKLVAVFPLIPNASFPLDAPTGVEENGQNYSFLFWNADNSFESSTATVVGPVNQDMTATAWYLRVGGGNGNGNNGQSAVNCLPFSVTDNAFLLGSPIESVAGGSWGGGNDRTVVTDANTEILAKNSMGGYPFHDWFIRGNASQISGATIAAAQGSSALAIAQYREKDPGIDDRGRIREILKGILEKLDPKYIGGLVTDPSPIDLVRLLDAVARFDSGAARAGVSDPRRVLERADEMSRTELRAAALELEAEQDRLKAFRKEIEAVLKDRDG